MWRGIWRQRSYFSGASGAGANGAGGYGVLAWRVWPWRRPSVSMAFSLCALDIQWRSMAAISIFNGCIG